MIVLQMKPACRQASAMICLLTVLLSTGCQFTPSALKMTWPWSNKKPPPQPDRVVAVWTDTVLHQTGQPGVRGFGGRVYFYEHDETDPIEIDGGLAVYVFDADKLQTSEQRPLRKFVFTADQFATHMSRTSLGPSYSVWLPWGEVGGPPMRLSLIARYEGVAGGTTISEPTIKLLPGVPVRSIESEREFAKARGDSSVQLAGHSKPIHSEARSEDEEENLIDDPSVQRLNRLDRRRQGIKTIDLPPSFQRHFERASADNPSGGDVQQHGSSATAPTSDGSNVAPSSESSASLMTLDPKSLSALAAAEASAPITTQVIDHRTRRQQRFHQSQSPTSRVDIREGRWIETPRRASRQEQ